MDYLFSRYVDRADGNVLHKIVYFYSFFLDLVSSIKGASALPQTLSYATSTEKYNLSYSCFKLEN